MNTFISMLRGINVSGQKKIRMQELRALYRSLGLDNVRSYVQSGNVIFDTPESDPAKLAGAIQNQIQQTFGYAVPVFIRTPADFQRIIAGNPFLNGRNEDPAKLYVTFLYQLPSPEKLNTLAAPNQSSDEFVIGEQEIFLYCPTGYGRTKLSNQFFEKKLQVPATTRNWKSVNALHTLALPS